MGDFAEHKEFSFFAPAGYYIALRIGFAFPMEEHNALPPRWVEHYTAKGLMLHDPIMKWLYDASGAIRWSEIAHDDPRQVMQQAKEFGLHYGVAVSCQDPVREGQRSFGSFARADREYTDVEIGLLRLKLQKLHDAKAPPANLTRAELEALTMVKNGLLLKEIADRLGISVGAVKQRLKNAKLKLNAKTSTQAATIAIGFGLI